MKKDVELFGKQDPYVKIVYNNKKIKTKVKQDAGKHAIWNETFSLDILNYHKPLKLEVWNKNMASDDLLGSVDTTVFTMVMGKRSKWHILKDSGGCQTGKLKVNVEWAPG